jgi:hypothetical protein
MSPFCSLSVEPEETSLPPTSLHVRLRVLLWSSTSCEAGTLCTPEELTSTKSATASPRKCGTLAALPDWPSGEAPSI